MFIIISIYSKNLNSLTNFLKFFYKLKRNAIFRLKFQIIQKQKKKNFYFFSVLQSPHVNKKSQEQFEYHMYSKKLKIDVSQMVKFLTVWKIVKTTLFSDVKIETGFSFYNKPSNFILLPSIQYDKFKLVKFIKPKVKDLKYARLSSKTTSTSLNVLDTRGEILLKTFFTCLDSSAGRAKDWKSLCRWFKSGSKRH